MLSVVMLSVIKWNVVILSVIRWNVVMLSVVAPQHKTMLSVVRTLRLSVKC